MSNEHQNVPLDVLQARHEAEQQNISNDDAVHLAGLFKTVGNELFSIDHKYVGGNSTTKALQLDQQKVFNKPITQASVQQAPVQQAPVQQAPVQQAPVQQAPVEIPHDEPVQPVPNQRPSVSVSTDIEDRIKLLEDKFNKIIKPPHKKVNVKYKSENISGIFDSFEDVVGALRKSLNKSSKRITITLNEN
jgi:hypothetical protein